MKKIVGISSIIFLLFCSSFDVAETETVKIGNLEWSTKNYDGVVFSNGDTISQVSSVEEWNKAFENQTPAWCYYDFDINNSDYGKIYNIHTILSPSKLAPNGWHVATYQDWNYIVDFLGGKKKANIKMKSIDEWKDDYKGDNTSGLNCKPVGGLSEFAGFWEPENGSDYWGIKVKVDSYIISRFVLYARNNGITFQFTNKDAYGAYVRLVKD
jgi:uncharacterized protein (TIGR02145 family)